MMNIDMMRNVPRTKNIPKDKIRKETAEIDRIIGLVETTNISKTNDLILAGGHLVSQRLNIVRPVKTTNRTKGGPPGKIRLEKQVESIRKDLGTMINVKEGRQQATRTMSYKYRLKRKGIDTVIEELKQRLKSTAAKIKRYFRKISSDSNRTARTFAGSSRYS